MPVRFLSPAHYQTYGQYNGSPSDEQLARYFTLDDFDQSQIQQRRREINRLGFALQLVTVRFLGTFIENMTTIPMPVLTYVASQLSISIPSINLSTYNTNNSFWIHRQQIIENYGYRPFHASDASFMFLRWLYTRTWIGSERPSVLFDLSTAWLIDQKILLPGVTTLERLVAQIRERTEQRSWRILNTQLNTQQQSRLQGLVSTQDENDITWDDLRRMPSRVSSPQINHALLRLENIRELDFHNLEILSVSANRLRTLADYALTAAPHTLKRLQPERQMAVLLAGIHLLTIRVQDLVLDMFEQWLSEAITESKNTVEQERLRTLTAYDQATFYLRDLAQFIVEASSEERATILARFASDDIKAAIATIDEVTQPKLQGYHGMLVQRYRSARLFLPAFLRLINFQGIPEADHVLNAVSFLRRLDSENNLSLQEAPRSVISATWRSLVYNGDGNLEREPYTLSVLHELYQRLRRRDIFVIPSERWNDPRLFLLDDTQWQKLRPQICRILDRNAIAKTELSRLSKLLDEEYRQTSEALVTNDNLRLETVDGHLRPVLTPLDALPETPQLHFLQQNLTGRLPAIDLPQLMLDVHQLTGFTRAFTHISEQQSRATDLPTSICAVLLAQGCNIGLEAVVDEHVPALTHQRLRWVKQNYVRPDTLVEASNWLVAAQSKISLAQHWGGGEMASADGLRFVVPQKAVHGRFNRKYFGAGRGVTFFNFLSDQFTGFHHVVIPGTLRESLYILDGLLDQTTKLRPKEVMTDTNSYTDIVFGLFWLLGFQFSPRLADIKHQRFWRMDRKADYGKFNSVARSCISIKRVAADWDDMLRVAGSLHTGAVSASQLMRIFSTTGGTTSLMKSIRDVGRIAKTSHMLHYIRDVSYQRHILIYLNHVEFRHKLARRLMYGNRGELKQSYREGQETQLSALGLLLNIVIYWNTLYLDHALTELLETGVDVNGDTLNRITPLAYDHIRILGRYIFTSPDDTNIPRYRSLKPMPSNQ